MFPFSSKFTTLALVVALLIGFGNSFLLSGLESLRKAVVGDDTVKRADGTAYKVWPPLDYVDERTPGKFSVPGQDLTSFPGNEDRADLSLAKINVGGRSVDLFHGEHFDDILRDTPDDLRPPGVVIFWDSKDKECSDSFHSLGWRRTAETVFPSRERLFVAQYDMYSAPRRAWYKFTPEMNLAQRFGVKQCPEIVAVPRKCNGFTKWCSRGHLEPERPEIEYMGCKDFTEQCTGFKSFPQSLARGIKQNKWSQWVLDFVKAEDIPMVNPFFKTMKEQNRWIRGRERTTCNTHMRNAYLTQGFPAFTPDGYLALPTPKKMQDWLMSKHKQLEGRRKTESWDGESTQLSFHESKTTFVDLDQVRAEKEMMANEILKPIVEKWSGFKDLELTSFYGIREYHNASWLRKHVDRIDTHVLSVTFSIAKLPEAWQDEAPNKPWPLEVTQWSGDHVRYDHPAGTMVLYESSKLMHGRPDPNEGGVHVGAFMHFKPVHLDGKEAAEWDDISRFARQNSAKWVKSVSYRERPVEEPVNPKFSSHNYGEQARWRHDGADNKKVKQVGFFLLEFPFARFFHSDS